MNALRALLCILAVVVPASVSRAEGDAGDADVQQYLREALKTFDFEESHPDLTPINWTKVDAPGYPAYTRGQFVTDVYHSRHTSFRMDLDGGNCAYEYEPRRIIIEPAFDYCLEGWIRTEGLKHSRARLAVWFNDQQGRMVEGSRVITAEVGGTTDWTLVQVHLSPRADLMGRTFGGRPRFAGLAMEVIGTEAQDIGAKVWFDDIVLQRIPRLRLELTEPRLTFAQGQPVTVELSADGLLASSFPGRLVIRDDRGRTVYNQGATLVPGDDGEARMRATLPDLPPGAYHASYDVRAERPTVLCRRVSYAVLAPLRGPPYLRGKGLGVADVTGVDDPQALIRLLEDLGVRTVKVPLWLEGTTPQEMEHGRRDLEEVINKLRLSGVEFVGMFAEPPEYLRRQVPETVRGVTDLLSLKEDIWQRGVGFTMSRYAGIISAWQIGKDDDPSVTRLQSEPGLLEAASRQMDRLTAGVPLGVPWPALYAWPERFPERVDFVALRVGPEILPNQIQEYLAGELRPGRPRAFLTLEPIARSGHDADERVFDFVSRVLAAKRVGVEQIFFGKLVDGEVGLMHTPQEPGELFVVARTLCDMLGGTRFAGWMPLENQASALVFERGDGSEIICLWKEYGKFPVKEPLYLGDNLVQVDLWGNASTLPQYGSVTSVDLQPMPVFITGIDPQISRTRRSFHLAGNSIPSAYRRHQSAIEFTNGFERGVSGYLRLQVPEGWNVDPTIIRFHLAEGERFVQPLVITVPYNEIVGDKEFVAEFYVDAKSSYRFIAVARTRFEMPTATTRAVVFQEGPSLVIEQEVTNIANRPLSYQAYIQVPGRPMLNHYIPKLSPGETVVKRYILPYTPSLENKSALVGVRDETPDRGFANLLLPLGGVHESSIVRTSSAGVGDRDR